MKDRRATLEAHVRVCYPPKQGFDELVNALAGLARKISESYLQCGVYTDRGVRHTSLIVPRRRRTQEGFTLFPACLVGEGWNKEPTCQK